MHPANPNEQYEAVIYTAKGFYTMDYFGNAEQAKRWILKEYKRMSGERAAAIYDHRQNKKKIFVMDQWFLIPK